MAEGDSSQVRVKLEQQNIKERLNMHVKRRLQQDPDVPTDNFEFPPGDNNGPTNLKRTKVKEAPKQRKPYQKRTEKAKTETTKGKKVGQLGSPATDVPEPLDEQEMEGGSPEAVEVKSSTRDRYKNADILNMVLSVKKCALMQDPEVQAFWSKVMTAIKS
ncbi:hypothetical protein KR074_002186 [Drosophila pseudoananassae]|nr:hypothetical protein KR074_002186 [Drosophila pseudoananassae]